MHTSLQGSPPELAACSEWPVSGIALVPPVPRCRADLQQLYQNAVAYNTPGHGNFGDPCEWPTAARPCKLCVCEWHLVACESCLMCSSHGLATPDPDIIIGLLCHLQTSSSWRASF